MTAPVPSVAAYFPARIGYLPYSSTIRAMRRSRSTFAPGIRLSATPTVARRRER